MGWYSCYKVLAKYGGRGYAPRSALKEADDTNTPDNRQRAWAIAAKKWTEAGKPAMCFDCETELVGYDHDRYYGRKWCVGCTNPDLKKEAANA